MELRIEHIQEITEVAVRLNKGEISILDDRRDFYYPLKLEDNLMFFNFKEPGPEFANVPTVSTLIVKFKKNEDNNWKLEEIRK